VTYLDLGDAWSHRFTVKVGGTLTNDATTSLTVYLPDGTSVSPSLTNTSTGLYDVAYTTTVLGWHRYVFTSSGNKDTGGFNVADPTRAPLVSLSAAKSHLNMSATDTTDDEELRRTLAVATDLAERYANRALRRKTVAETHDGGGSVLLLRQPPVASVTSVTVGGVATTAYVLDPAAGLLYAGTAGGSTWAAGWQNIVVTYVAGGNAPEVAEQAVLELTRHLWQTQRGSSVGLPGLGGGDDVYAPGLGYAMPRRVTELLDTVRMGGFA
jgi:hypothetical protein